MKIRKITKKDFKEISRLIKVEYLKHYKEKWTEKNAAKTLDYYQKIGKIFVAELKGVVVGFVIFKEEYYNDKKMVKIEELIVNGKLQGKGIGKELMQFVENYCKENKISLIWLITGKEVGAFKFYKKIGYKHSEKTAYLEKEVNNA
ncbi:MAG: GNAT family N-acetyltransferase [Nanoarchaeota archaeon]|nr:GNAT family N-acetyltransferase [Nanoarchaeota archaeon]